MKAANKEFKIATEFSTTPGPRFSDEGEFSGEKLRVDHLFPIALDALSSGERILIDLDGTHGYLTSFLEEAFGGLIRVNDMKVNDLERIFEFKSLEEPYLVEDIREYLKEAADATQ